MTATRQRNGAVPNDVVPLPLTPNPSPPCPARLEGLHLLTQAIEQLVGTEPGFLQLHVQLRGCTVRLSIQPTEALDEEPPDWPEVEAPRDISMPDGSTLRLRAVHRRLLKAATSQPASARRLANRAGYKRSNSYTRTGLTDLVRARLLLHTPDGYQLP